MWRLLGGWEGVDAAAVSALRSAKDVQDIRSLERAIRGASALKRTISDPEVLLQATRDLESLQLPILEAALEAALASNEVDALTAAVSDAAVSTRMALSTSTGRQVLAGLGIVAYIVATPLIFVALVQKGTKQATAAHDIQAIETDIAQLTKQLLKSCEDGDYHIATRTTEKVKKRRRAHERRADERAHLVGAAAPRHRRRRRAH